MVVENIGQRRTVAVCVVEENIGQRRTVALCGWREHWSEEDCSCVWLERALVRGGLWHTIMEYVLRK